MKPMMQWLLFFLSAAALCGCTLAKVDVAVVSERTSLENQVLGTYNALDTEMLLTASVRGVDPQGNIRIPPKKSREQQDAIAALQVEAFHADDLQAFKQLGWVGENREGLITPFPRTTANAPPDLADFAARYSDAEFTAVVAQVNDAREVIMQRVVDLNPDLSAENLPEIRRIFARRNAETALPGERIQSPDGTWATKE